MSPRQILENHPFTSKFRIKLGLSVITQNMNQLRCQTPIVFIECAKVFEKYISSEICHKEMEEMIESVISSQNDMTSEGYAAAKDFTAIARFTHSYILNDTRSTRICLIKEINRLSELEKIVLGITKDLEEKYREILKEGL